MARKRGRPPKSKQEGKSASLSIRIRPELLRGLREAADEADRSITDEMEMRLQYTFDERLTFGTVSKIVALRQK